MVIKLSHPDIIQFYEKYTHIDCENVNLLFIKLMRQLIPENEKSGTSIVDKMFTKLSTIENFITSCDSTHNLNNVMDSYLKNTQDLLIREISIKSQEVTNKTNQDNISHFIQPIVNSISNNIDNKFNIWQSQIVQPITNKITENEIRTDSKFTSLQQTAYNNHNLCDELNKDLKEYLTRMKNSYFKGQYAENKLRMILQSLYPQSSFDNESIKQTSHTKKSGDFLLHRGNDLPKILIENKEYDSKKVPDEEVKKFIRDVEEQKCHGIMLSQNNEISCKTNYHIDIHKSYLLLYIGNVNYDSNKINIAVNTIDFLHKKLLPILENNLENENSKSISSVLLDNINNEYQYFIKSKETLFTLIHDNHKKLIQQLQDIQLPCLNNLLDNYYANTHEIQVSCKFCGKIFKGRCPKKL